jgi:Mg-chelatase subunit ChlD
MMRGLNKIVIIGLLLCLAAASTSASWAQGPDALAMERSVEPSKVNVGDEVTVTLTLHGNTSTCKTSIVRTPVDIVLVVDVSGSMADSIGMAGGQSKQEGAQAAAHAFVDAVELGTDRIAVTQFDSSASLVQGLSTDRGAIQDAIDKLSGGGGTNFAAGLQTAIAELDHNKRPDANGVIVFLSDGLDYSGQSEAQQARNAGYRIITVGLGGDVNDAQLRGLASSPDDYYFAPDTDALQKIYVSIAQTLRKPVAASQVVLEHTFDVTNFELVPGSITPPGQIGVSSVIWKVDKISDENLSFSFRLRPRTPGTFDLDKGDQVGYAHCGESSSQINLGPGLPVTVSGDIKSPAVSAPPVTSEQRLWSFLCGDFPWWWLLALLLALLLLYLMFFRNLLGIRDWVTRRKRPRWCRLALALLLFYLIILLALILGTLRPVVCTPREAIYFWRIHTNGDAGVFFKSTMPDMLVQPLTPLNRLNSFVAYPSLSRELGRIAASQGSSNGQLVVMDLQGTLLTVPDIHGSYMSWSPDGRQLAISANDKDIYIIDIASGSATPLAGANDPNVIETMPSWSPDGQTIAFVRAVGDNDGFDLNVPSDIMTIPATGGTPVLLAGASGNGFNYYPAYSPDGRWLAFTRHTTGTRTYYDPNAEIYVVPATGGAPVRLEANDGAGGQPMPAASNSMPTWSKDGNRLYFSSQRDSAQFDIFVTVIRPDGHSGPAERVTELVDYEDPGAFEHLAQPGSPVPYNFWAKLVDLWPWLIPIPLLILMALLLCRRRTYPDTIELRRDVLPHPPEMTLGQGEFQVRLSLIPHTELCRDVQNRQPVDTVLVLDVSESMGEQQGTVNKLEGARLAAKAFMRELGVGPGSDQDRVAIVGFAEQASLVEALSGDIQQVSNALDRLTPAGSTAINTGLEQAITHLEESGRAGVAPVIVLLSDGEQEDIEPVLQAAQRAHNLGVRLITVGLGSEAGQNLLQQIASQSGDYRFAPSVAELKDLYRQIAISIQKPIAARDLTFTHTFDTSVFELVPGSIYPPARIAGNQIVWTLAEIGQAPRTFSYRLKPLHATKTFQNIDLGDRLVYICCAGVEHKQEFGPALPVSVLPVPDVPAPIKRRQLLDPLPISQPLELWRPDPALVIGLGYSGRWILTHLKKNLRDAGAGRVSNQIPLLLVDTGRYKTDLEQQKAQPVRFAGVELDEDQDRLVILDENLKTIINSGKQDPYLQDWIPLPGDFGHDDSSKSLRYGTGGKRAMGRVGLVHQDLNTKQPLWLQKIWPALLELVSRVKTEQGVQIIITGSLAEGMSGVLLDVAHLARQAAYCKHGSAAEVSVVAYLSITTDQDSDRPGEDNTLPLNTMAALRELERFALHPGTPFSLGYKVTDEKYKDLILGQVEGERPITDVFLFGEAQQGVEWTLYPSMADLIALRLDRETWTVKLENKQQDRLAQEHVATAKREKERYEFHFGTAGVKSIQVPVADIVEQMKVRFARELIHVFLAGDSREALRFEPALATVPGLSSASSETVAMRLLAGELYWELNAHSPTGALAFVQASQGPLGSALETRLQGMLSQAIQQEDAGQFRRYLSEALSFLLTGSAGLTRPPAAPHLAFALELLQEIVNLVQSPNVDKCISAQDSTHGNAGNAMKGLRQFYLEVLKAAQSDLREIASLIVGQAVIATEGKKGIYEALEEYQIEAEQLPKQMSKISHRQYIWNVETTTQSGQLLSQELNELWFAQYGAPKVTEACDYLGWEVLPDGKFELVLRTQGDQSPLRLSEVGVDGFKRGLLNVVAQIMSDVWRAKEARFDFVGLPVRRYLNNVYFAGLPWMCWGINDQLSSNPDYSALLVGPPSAGAVLREIQVPLGTSLRSGTEPILQVISSNPYAMYFVRAVDGVPISALHQYDKAQKFYQQSRERRAILPAEVRARNLELEIAADLEKREALRDERFHPLIVIALEFPERSRLFALALASGWIDLSGGKIRWQVPSKDQLSVEVPSWPDSAIWALLEFAFLASEDRVREVQTDLDDPSKKMIESWRVWEENAPEDFLQHKNEPRLSLARYVRSVVIDMLRKAHSEGKA